MFGCLNLKFGTTDRQSWIQIQLEISGQFLSCFVKMPSLYTLVVVLLLFISIRLGDNEKVLADKDTTQHSYGETTTQQTKKDAPDEIQLLNRVLPTVSNEKRHCADNNRIEEINEKIKNKARLSIVCLFDNRHVDVDLSEMCLYAIHVGNGTRYVACMNIKTKDERLFTWDMKNSDLECHHTPGYETYLMATYKDGFDRDSLKFECFLHYRDFHFRHIPRVAKEKCKRGVCQVYTEKVYDRMPLADLGLTPEELSYENSLVA